MRRPILIGLLLTAVITAPLTACSSVSDVEVTSGFIIDSLDPDCIGCGPDVFSDTETPHAMAFALLASTGALLADRDLAEAAADWLVENSQPTGTSVGWGLGLAWDAFGDGSTNPASTIYGITTALAVRGLFDAFELTGKEAYSDTALAALHSYLPFHTTTGDGLYFWYSDQPVDAIDTFNVSAMLMGQYARAGKQFQVDEFSTTADLAARSLLSNVEHVGDLIYWNYSSQEDRPNDVVHASYIVQGLLDYAQASGADVDPEAHAGYLRNFLFEGGVREFNPIHGLDASLAERPARLWGVGMLAYTLAEAGDLSGAQGAADALSQYLGPDGKLVNLPNSESPSEPRMTSHAALGLARIGR